LFKGRLSQSWISENPNFHLFTVKGGFFPRLRFKEKKIGIYNLIGPQFWANPPLALNEEQLKFTLT